MINKQELAFVKKDKQYIEYLIARIFDDVPKSVAKKMLKYALSKEVHNEVLARIEEKIFFNAKSQKNPTLHLIISQTGGGKTALKEYVKQSVKDAISIT